MIVLRLTRFVDVNFIPMLVEFSCFVFVLSSAYAESNNGGLVGRRPGQGVNRIRRVNTNSPMEDVFDMSILERILGRMASSTRNTQYVPYDQEEGRPPAPPKANVVGRENAADFQTEYPKTLPRMYIGSLLDNSYIKRELEELKRGVKLANSSLSYMGRVEVAMPDEPWGTICGDGWTVQDATVVCRQLGLRIGGVISRKLTEFGAGSGPVVMSKVRCRGDETSLLQCPSLRWDGKKSLPCSKYLQGASVICGCPLDVSPRVKTRCFVYTGVMSESLSCHYSCPKNSVLVGDKRRYCNSLQKWTGIRPSCIRIRNSRKVCKIPYQRRMSCLRVAPLGTSSLRGDKPKSISLGPKSCLALGCCYDESFYPRCYLPATSPCALNRCENGGQCRDQLGSNAKYECLCSSPFGGKHCQYKRDWTCGVQAIRPNMFSRKPTVRIIGGREAVKGSWPWTVQIHFNGSYICAGTLIHRQWVLTAAHCMSMRGASVGRNYGTSWKIVIGRHLLNGEGGKEEQTINVSYMTYKNYSNESVHLNDIALMKLNKAVTLNNYSNIICLPKTQDENPFPGTKCWIAGWGSMLGFSDTADSLQQADLPIITKEDCIAKQSYDRYYHLVNDNMICAGYKEGGIDACSGDSGGPLMCQRPDDSWYVAGVVSWGYQCGDPDSPGVYTRVSKFLDWIHQVVIS